MPGESADIPLLWRVGEIIEGRYEVTGVNQQGGMGLVYRVRHREWGTDLAVKSPRPESFRNARDRERFTAEAEAWVSLGLHPNVCACHYVRTLGGIPRVFAEYVPGGSLRERIDDRRLYEGEATARIIDLAVQVAWGLEHAHARGLVHRDVKPANVLLDRDGTAKITDFGLARARAMAVAPPPGALPGADPETTFQATGDAGMTPAYASPEQVAGRPVGRHGDVYGFGVTVLEMVTGRITWMSGPVAGAALEAFLSEGGSMPPGLAGLLERCLRQDPAERPGSMAEVAGALREIYREATGRDHPRAVPAAADLRAGELNNRALSLLDLGRDAEAEEAFAQALAADPQHVEATYNAGLARWRRGTITDEDLVTSLEAVRSDAGDSWQVLHLLAQVHMERGDLTAARALLDDAERRWPGEPDVRAALGAVRTGGIASAGRVEADERRIPWSGSWGLFSTGIRLVSEEVALTWRLAGTTLDVWDIPGGRPRKDFQGSGLDSVDVSPDGRLALSRTLDDVLELWDLTTGRCLRSFDAPAARPGSRVLEVRLHAGAGLVLAGVSARNALLGRAAAKDGVDHILVWDLATGRLLRILDGYDGAPIQVSRDGRRVFSSGGLDRTARLWDLDGGRLRRIPMGHDRKPVPAALSADGRTALTGGADRSLRLWDLDRGECVRTLTGHAGPVSAVALSPDGRRALSGGRDGTVRVWELPGGRCLRTFRGHGAAVASVVLAADGRSGRSVGGDDIVHRWTLPGDGHVCPPRLSRPRRHDELSRLGAAVEAMVAEAERAMAAERHRTALDLLTRARTTPGHERSPRVLDAWRALGDRTGRTGLRGAWHVRTLTGHDAHVMSAGLSADGRTAVSSGTDGTVRLWDLRGGDCTRVLPVGESPVASVGLSADGRRALTSSINGIVRVWSAETGRCLTTVNVATGRRLRESRKVRFGTDGRLALVGEADALLLWDLESGRCLRTTEYPGVHAQAVWIGSGAGLVASSWEDGTVRLWNPGTGARQIIGDGPAGGRITSVCLSADQRRVLTGGGPPHRSGLRLWDVESGVVRAFEDGRTTYGAVRLTADGRFAVSGCGDAAVRVWDVAAGRCLRVLDGHQEAVSDIALTPDARFVLSAGDDGALRLWELDWELDARDPADRAAGARAR